MRISIIAIVITLGLISCSRKNFNQTNTGSDRFTQFIEKTDFHQLVGDVPNIYLVLNIDSSGLLSLSDVKGVIPPNSLDSSYLEKTKLRLSEQQIYVGDTKLLNDTISNTKISLPIKTSY
ncbi:hypothetical protein KMW28_09900 [Flammeovirga yaeyamensis]|uniref:Uncharacterized protein n=1 Tax=Flammeovirga yaeyamensis TaxID=367791 RepID=A0AAX1NBP3_9BACT|nr:hypothetical protein [Flammeovirga yaeyamensis]MBB3698730.1 hypothetical protein [Flammeovirga yaeyamensis]NMF37316.1 hypothetical protein [Flammeovirga yaeyamensis]QWG03866.1 hypothetical protein KMW28_09900 [Flammeovirga yaeyamensis]